MIFKLLNGHTNMNTFLDCIPCFFRQALEMSRLAGASLDKQKAILDALAEATPKFSMKSSPPEIGRLVYQLVSNHIGEKDIYQTIRQKSILLALGIYSTLKEQINKAKDPLLKAVELAIAGNIIDYGAKNSLNVEDEIQRILDEKIQHNKSEKISLFNYQSFKQILEQSKHIVYLGDNAGETVFDRLLLEVILKQYPNIKIIYAVKEHPIINDALVEDAIGSGLDALATIVSSGSDAPGTVLSLCSDEFIQTFNNADMIISKGQGNFEALADNDRSIFFLLIAKCKVISNLLDCNVGDIILKQSNIKEKS